MEHYEALLIFAEETLNINNAMSTSDIILKANHLRKTFGGVLALNDVSFDLKRNEITALIGPNGAGKTTIINLVSGVYPLTSGEIIFKEKMISGLKPFRIAEKRITRTFQTVQVIQDMTVIENVMIGLHPRTKSEFVNCLLHLPSCVKEEQIAREEGYSLLRYINLERKSEWLSSKLTYREQKMLEIARALAGNPELILLDEPVAGLSKKEIYEMSELLLKIRDKGISILLVEHNMNFVMSISNKIIVLDYGRKISEGTSSEVQTDQKVIQAYLGYQ
jgi:branched-chain amino acid transport system ATP-binding protein